MNKNIKSFASQRLKKFNDENKQPPTSQRIKKFGREENLFDIEIIEKGRYGNHKRLIEVSTFKNESNYKFLKLWKLYQPTEPSRNQYEYGKHGITLPIKDAKKLVKELYEIFYPKKSKEEK